MKPVKYVLIGALAVLSLSACETPVEEVNARDAYAIVYWSGTDAFKVSECTNKRFPELLNKRFGGGSYKIRLRGNAPLTYGYFAPSPNAGAGFGFVGALVGELASSSSDSNSPSMVAQFHPERAELRAGGPYNNDGNKNGDLGRAVFDCVGMTGGRVTGTYWYNAGYKKR